MDNLHSLYAHLYLETCVCSSVSIKVSIDIYKCIYIGISAGEAESARIIYKALINVGVCRLPYFDLTSFFTVFMGDHNFWIFIPFKQIYTHRHTSRIEQRNHRRYKYFITRTNHTIYILHELKGYSKGRVHSAPVRYTKDMVQVPKNRTLLESVSQEWMRWAKNT